MPTREAGSEPSELTDLLSQVAGGSTRDWRRRASRRVPSSVRGSRCAPEASPARPLDAGLAPGLLLPRARGAARGADLAARPDRRDPRLLRAHDPAPDDRRTGAAAPPARPQRRDAAAAARPAAGEAPALPRPAAGRPADLGGQPLRLAPAAALRTGAGERARPLARARHVLRRRDADVGGADRADPRPYLVRLRRQGDLRAGGPGARLRDPRQHPDLVGRPRSTPATPKGSGSGASRRCTTSRSAARSCSSGAP